MAAKKTKKSRPEETSPIIQIGIAFFMVAAIGLFAYAFKMFTP